MRVVSWNCRKGLSSQRKIDFLDKLSPDLLVLQEAYEKDLFCAHQRFWYTNKPNAKVPQGLGIYSFDPRIQIKPIKTSDDFEIVKCFEVQFQNISFNLLALWSFNGRSVGKYNQKKGMILDAINSLGFHLGSKSLLVGDFNNGPELKNNTWPKTVDLLKSKKMHRLNSQATHWQRSRIYTVDHAFVGEKLKSKTHLWKQKGKIDFSDHAPLVLEVK